MSLTAKINKEQIEVQIKNLKNLQVSFRDNLMSSIDQMIKFKEAGLRTEGQFEIEFQEKIDELVNLKTKIDLDLEEYINYLSNVISVASQAGQEASNILNSANLNNITGVFGGK